MKTDTLMKVNTDTLMKVNLVALTGLIALLTVFSFGLPKRAAAIGSGDADAAITAFNNAFLVTSGSSIYYKTSLSDSAADNTWLASLDIMGEEDAYERTGSTAHQTLVNNLCTTWLQNTPPGSATQPWSWDGWNDDIGWFTMALARGYQMTGNTNFLTQAANGFNYAYSRGWDTQYNGGGIWEQQPSMTPAGQTIDKEALSNDSLGVVACLLYQSTHNAAYLNEAQQIYGWVWNHIYNSSTGEVYTGVDRSGNVNTSASVYNQGLFIDYANYLYQMTGNVNYYNDAVRTINYTKNNLTTGGVISNSAGYLNTWADTLARGVGHFVRDNRQWGTYYPWMVQNENAAWGCRRTDYNIAWNGWAQQTPTNNALPTSQFVSAVAWLQFTPAIQPSAIAGVHVIVSQQNGITVDNGGGFTTSSANIAGVIQWGPSPNNLNQKWNFTQNADTSWNIVSESSWQALDDPGGTTTNGTQMIQWPLSRASNQRWWVDQQPNGSYKIWNQASGSALDNSSSAVNGHPLVQWGWNGQPQQLWLLQ